MEHPSKADGAPAAFLTEAVMHAASQVESEPDFEILIESAATRPLFHLRAIWKHRELLYMLTWRDVKVRYKQAALGVAWVVMQPLLMTLIFTIFLGALARVPSDGHPYALFAYTGILPWTFFANAVNNSGNSVVASASLLTKIYFPRVIIPIAALGSRLVDLAVEFSILGVLLVYYHVAPTWHLVMLLPLVIVLTALALGVGMINSGLNVRFRDVGLVLPVLMQLWMYASPIVYPVSLVPPRWQGVYALNPIVGIIDAFRTSVFGGSFNWVTLGVSGLCTLGLLFVAALAFRRMEHSFADII